MNTAAVDAVGRLADREDLQVLLLTGPSHERRVVDALAGSSGAPTRVRGFLERMELAYAIADLVVSRAGATTCAELSVCGVPAVLVPYPHATGRHQDANARSLERAGAAVVLADDALSGAVLASLVRTLLDDPARLASMRERMRSWARPDAAEALAGAVLRAGGGR